VQDAECRVQSAGCRVRVQGAGSRVQGLGCRVQGLPPDSATSSPPPSPRQARHATTPLQGYLAHKKHRPVGPYSKIFLGPYGGPRGGKLFLI